MKRSDDKLKRLKSKKIGFCLVEICETRVAVNLISFGLTTTTTTKKKNSLKFPKQQASSK